MAMNQSKANINFLNGNLRELFYFKEKGEGVGLRTIWGAISIKVATVARSVSTENSLRRRQMNEEQNGSLSITQSVSFSKHRRPKCE